MTPHLYIKYKDNWPVELFTEDIPIRPVYEPTVAGLLAASVTEPPGVPEDYGPLTLHYGVDGEALEPDILSYITTGGSFFMGFFLDSLGVANIMILSLIVGMLVVWFGKPGESSI
jgi:hypothetical protein